MNSVLRNTLPFGLAALLVLGLVWRMGAAEEKKAEPAAAGKVTVVTTDGAHLIAVDNATQTLYYYAIERDGKIGDEVDKTAKKKKRFHERAAWESDYYNDEIIRIALTKR